MTDVHSKELRSKNMRAIHSKNTKVEVYVRSLLHRQGFRFRIHSPHLPSKPDIYLAKYNAVIWVHGCFWHGHDCHLFKWPQSNQDQWKAKILGNKRRDAGKKAELHAYGIKIMTVWECALKGKQRLLEGDLIKHLEEWLLSVDHDSEITGRSVNSCD